jgi:hypothetical protein
VHDIEDIRRREADRHVAAVIYLMSCHARSRCPRLAAIVERHLALIGQNPESGEQVRNTCLRLAAAWANVRAHDERELAACGPRGTANVLH